MLWANKRTQKTAKKNAHRLFLSLNRFCKKNIKAKKSFKSRIKMSHYVTTETKNLLI